MSDVVVIGGGHNGLVSACYLARAGLDVVVLEQSDTPGGCINTRELADGSGKLELGAYEHGGILGSGVAADLELESRYGLQFHLRDEVTLAPCDDGTTIAFHSSLEKTLALLGEVVSSDDVEAYRNFANWASSAAALIGMTEHGPPPAFGALAGMAQATLGSEAAPFLQAMLGSATNLLRGVFDDERLQGPMAHWAAHSQQSPADPGTGAGTLMLAGGHGHPAARPVGGSQSTVTALVKCLEAAGGRLVCNAPVERVEISGGRAVAVVAAGERYEASDAVVSAIDAGRLFRNLIDPAHVPADLKRELRRVHSGRRNVSELKVDAVIESLPDVHPEGFERSFMLSANTTTDIERAFASVQLGDFAERPPMMIAFPSSLEPGWAPEGKAVVWLSTFVPWTPRGGEWNEDLLDQAADLAWKTAERALGAEMKPVERRITGPAAWVARHGNANANPNHIEMSLDQLMGFRPTPSLSGYSTPIGGLFLTGAGTHPGGGITGVPGRNAAHVVLGKLKAHRGSERRRRVRENTALLADAARAARALRKAG